MATASCNLQLKLLFLLFFCHLWPCFLAAVNISHLPGFNGELPFRLETGYVTMDEESGAELFYYFVESERNPNEDPLLLWLIGGPGCSGFNGLALDMGPLRFKVDDFDGNLPTIVANPYAWTKIASMIYLDWPIGTGFSYSRNDKDYFTEDVHAKKLLYEFLKKWLLDHPRFLLNPFYMGGESYGGKMAALVAHEIVEGNEEGQQPQVNIKGYLVGNAITGDKVDKNSQVPHAYGLGIIPEELYKLIKKGCVGEDYVNPQNVFCAAQLKVFNDYLSEINSYSILDPKCSDEPPTPQENVGDGRSLEENYAQFLTQPSIPDTSCLNGDLLANYWVNNNLVRKALQIKEGTLGRWHRCDFNVNAYHYTRSIPSSVPYHYNLIRKGYRALVYNGDHDMRIPFLGSLKWIKSLGFSVLDPWRSWHVNDQVAGYTVLFSNNLTFATVKVWSSVRVGVMWRLVKGLCNALLCLRGGFLIKLSEASSEE
ncbi:Serine carboxypeptidase-like 18 [Dendrobium catenatum]|uniref:Carboxypeptidase n=1 Tax=Dendrobium catenatum TaxID=906689 RepID=A0A2I0X6D4_9ASPA|nr:Serine carboxypeptidase-like 18 [Dendrobium catenatum]